MSDVDVTVVLWVKGENPPNAETACQIGVDTSAVVDTTFVDIYVDTKNIPICRYNIQHIDKRTMEK